MGSTDITVDQGGSGGSDALQTDGYPMRRVAAEARRVLLDMAAAAVRRSRHGAHRERRRRLGRRQIRRSSVTYGELIGGKKFNVTLTGNNIDATTGRRQLKPVQAHEERRQVAAALRHSRRRWTASLKWAVDVKLPGMVHARNVKPPVAGATLVSIDESSVKRLPGFVQGRQQGQLRGRRLRARRAGDPRRPSTEGRVEEAGDARRSRLPTISSPTCATTTPSSTRPAGGHRQSRHRVCRRGEGGRGANTTCRSRDTPRLAPRTPWPIRRTIR